MGLASDFGKSIVRGAGYSIGRNLVGNLGRNRVTSSYRERVSDSYENKRINERFERSVFDSLDESEEGARMSYQSKLEKSNWEFIGPGQSFLFALIGIIMWFVFCTVNTSFLLEYNIMEPGTTLWKGDLFKRTLILVFIVIFPIFQSKIFLKLLHFFSGTQKRKEKEAKEYLDDCLKNIENLRRIYNETIEIVKNSFGEEIVSFYEKRIPKEGMHIEPFQVFFGKPDKEEITEKGKNLIYGTSKQAGDWFKFEGDYLKSFTIK